MSRASGLSWIGLAETSSVDDIGDYLIMLSVKVGGCGGDVLGFYLLFILGNRIRKA